MAEKKQNVLSEETKLKNGFQKMFLLDNIAFPLAVISLIFTFADKFVCMLNAASWLCLLFYCFAFLFAILSLAFSLVSACNKTKVSFLPSMVVALVAIFAIVV